MASNKIYQIAILGCGKVAHLHAKAISGIENARLAGVWSRSPETARNFAQIYQTQSYPTVSELVKGENIDLAIVCTPHPFHMEPAVEAARNGAHLLVEKPLSVSLAHSDQIIYACATSGTKLGVVSQRRWYAPAMRVKNAITGGKLGQPSLGIVTMLGWRDREYYESDAWRGTWEMEGGGVLVNQAPHQLDLLLWYMGDVEEVYAVWRNINHPYIEVEDTALAILKFKSGAIGNIVVSNAQKPGLYGKVHIHGSNGASIGVQTDGGAMFIAGRSSIAEPPVNDLWTIPGEEHLLKQWQSEDEHFFTTIDPTVHYMKLQIEDFLAAIRNQENPAVDGLAGRKVVELFNAIYESTATRKPILLPA